jgi:hypothetical protein
MGNFFTTQNATTITEDDIDWNEVERSIEQLELKIKQMKENGSFYETTFKEPQFNDDDW